MKKRQKLLAVLLSFAMVATLFPIGAMAYDNSDWLKTGLYVEDFEGDTSFVLDTERSGPYETCNAGAYQAPRCAVVDNTLAEGGINTSAHVFRAEGLNSWNSTWGDTWEGGEPHTGFQLFSPDIWDQAAENGLQLQQVAFDAVLNIARSYQYIVFYKWNSINDYAFFSLYAVPNDETGLYRLEVEDNVRKADSSWSITPVPSGTATDTFGDAWSRVKLAYDAEGYVTLSVYNPLNGIMYNYKSTTALAEKDGRYFSATTTQYGAALVDNVSLAFSDEGVARAFQLENQAVLSYAADPGSLPADTAAVRKQLQKTMTDYNALSDAVKAFLTEEGAALAALEEYLNTFAYLNGEISSIDFENGETLLHDPERSGEFTAQNNQAQIYKLVNNPYPGSVINPSATAYQIATHQESSSAWKQNNFQLLTPDVWKAVQQKNMQLQSVTLDTSLESGISYGQVFYYKFNSRTDWAAFSIAPNGDEGNRKLDIRNYYCTDEIWAEIQAGTRTEIPFHNLLNGGREESDYTAGFTKTWATVNLQYEESGNVVLKVYCENNGKTFSFNSGADLAEGDTRFFAITNTAHGTMYVDNINLYFSQDAYITAFTDKYADLIALGNDISAYPTDPDEIAAVEAAVAAFDLDYPRLSDAAQADSRIIAAQSAVEAVKSAMAASSEELKAFTEEYADVLAHVSEDLTVTDPTAAGLADRTAKALEDFAALAEDVRSTALAVQLYKRLQYLDGYIRYMVLVEDGVYTQDFEQASDFAPLDAYQEYPETETGPVTDHPKNGVLPETDNTVYKIKSVIPNYGGFHDADMQKYAQFVTANPALFGVMADNGKYLSAGSFDLYLTSDVFNEHEITYSFTDANHFSFMGLYANGKRPNGLECRDYTVSGTAADFPYQDVARIYAEDPTGQWYHFNFFYDTEGKFQLVMTDKDGVPTVFTGSAVEPALRMLAFGSMGNNRVYYIDNVVMRFAENGQDAVAEQARSFLTQKSFLRDVMEMDTATIVPYDFARINGFIDSYEALSPAAGAQVSKFVVARIDGFKEQMAKWNTASDTDIVDSFKAIYTTLDATALRVYSRLTASQKELLQAEYAAMQAAVSTAAADDTVDIACIGDSITAGNGSEQIEVDGGMVTPSYPYRLQEQLGSGYTVSNFGIAGIRILDAYDFAISTSTDGQYKGTGQYYQSVNMQPDMVIIMLGTNDLNKFKTVNTAESRQQLKTAYTDLVHSYLALASNPTVLLATVPEQRGRTYDESGINDLVSGLIREVADTYGLPVIDIYAMTSAWTDAQLQEYFHDDLHPNNTGYEQLAALFAGYIQAGKQISNTAAGCIIDFSDAQYNQYAPQMLGASISTDAATQRLWFKSAMGYTKSGAKLVEYGTIFTYTQYIGNQVAYADMVYGTNNAYVTVASAPVSALGFGEQFIGNTFKIAEENYGVRVIARSYVRYSDGSVYYSVNTTAGGSIAQAAGVENGYASRSIIGISKSIMGWTYQNRENALLESIHADLDTYITEYDAVTGQFGWTDAAKENNGLPIIQFICENAAVISKAIEQIGQ